MEEFCLAEMADYDRVYYDDEKGASISLKMFEEATQERDEPEHSLRTRSRSRLRSHSNWDTMGLHGQGSYRTSSHPCHAGCTRDEEDDTDGFDGHVFDIRCDPTVEGFRLLLL